MKAFLRHLDWGLGTKGPHSDPPDKTFLGGCIVSNVSNWSNLLLKMRYKLLLLAPVLLTRHHVYPRLKTVAKTFLEKAKHESTIQCTKQDMLYFRAGLLICPYRKKSKHEKSEKV